MVSWTDDSEAGIQVGWSSYMYARSNEYRTIHEGFYKDIYNSNIIL